MPPARTHTLPHPARPVSLDATRRVAVVIPCFNDAANLAALAQDLDRTAPAGVTLDVIVIDNASAESVRAPTIRHPCRVVRLPENRGGSGGFNTGIALALAAHPRPELVWLIDSDARVEPDTLARLIAAVDDERVVASGPVLVDPETGQPHERGGAVDRRTGTLGNADGGSVDFLAACCLLVRTEAIDRAGLMPDLFLNGDDAAWGVRLAEATGGRLALAEDARAAHPRFDRFKGIARYYSARNGFAVIDDLGLGRRVRLRRALLEVARAIGQTMIGRDDFARLHVLGLRDAARGTLRTPGELPGIEPASPIDRLGDALGTTGTAGRSLRIDAALDDATRQVLGRHIDEARVTIAHPARSGITAALVRTVLPRRADFALVCAKGRPSAWTLGRTVVSIQGTGEDARFAVRRVRTVDRLCRALLGGVAGTIEASRIGLLGAHRASSPLPRVVAQHHTADASAARPSVSVVVLSYNRSVALSRTLDRIARDDALAGAEVIVVDNASGDGSADMVRTRHPDARLIGLDENVAIEGFNVGVRAATSDAVLILDDDAWPDEGAAGAALDALAADPSLGAVTLLPVHPKTNRPEWAFAEAGPSDAWPVMGCGNLVRRDVWLAAGGYERGYFLYRNDADLAMTIAAMGLGVRFDPRWIVWHDSPATTRKSARWFRTATRNWLWMCRRHGRGSSRTLAMLAGVAWAGRLAGLRPRDHAALVRGIWTGLASTPPPLPRTARVEGSALRRLMRLRFRGSLD